MNEELQDQKRRCPCGNSFVWYREKQVEYQRRGWTAPVYCRDCGWKRKLEKLKATTPKRKEMSDAERFGY